MTQASTYYKLTRGWPSLDVYPTDLIMSNGVFSRGAFDDCRPQVRVLLLQRLHSHDGNDQRCWQDELIWPEVANASNFTCGTKQGTLTAMLLIETLHKVGRGSVRLSHVSQ